MEVKRKACSVVNCQSSTIRVEDRGVTFHKYPKNEELRQLWLAATRHGSDYRRKHYVCSRHFYKADFELFEESKYILRTDAVPSIFSWNIRDIARMMEDQTAKSNSIEETLENNVSSVSDPPIGEVITNEAKKTLDEDLKADKESIEEDKKDGTNNFNALCLDEAVKVNNLPNVDKKAKMDEISHTNVEENSTGNNEIEQVLNDKSLQLAPINSYIPSERDSITVIRSMIHSNDCIELDDSISDLANSSEEALANIIDSPKSDYNLSKKEVIEEDGVFTVGSNVEAKDFDGQWHPVCILEVDSDDMEVLVHYKSSQRNDEWISVSSSRIRAPTSLSLIQPPSTQMATKLKTAGAVSDLKNDVKIPLDYRIGERCYARWSDNRRFPATVRKILGAGKYEIIFDDGICRICPWYCLSKMKKKKSAAMSTTRSRQSTSAKNAPKSSTPEPEAPAPPQAPYHRHLFDPQLDYLGSKSERRAMKKKLDVKALFNIGKKKTTKRKLSAQSEHVPQAKKKRSKGTKHSLNVLLDNRKIKNFKDIDAPEEDVQQINELIEMQSESCVSSMPEPYVKLENSGNKYPSSEIVNESQPVTYNECSGMETKITDTEEIQKQSPHKVDGAKRRKSGSKKGKKVLKLKKDVAYTVIEKTLDGIEKIKHDIISPKLDDTSSTQETFTVLAKPINTADINILGIDKELSAPTYTANVPVEDDGSYNIDIDEGLQLIARAVESFTADEEEKPEVKPQNVVHESGKVLLAAPELNEAMLSEGQWCCKWLDGEPQGVVCESDTEAPVKGDQPALPRKSVMVEDKRLPVGWTKMLVRRCCGSSAGKWDVVLIDPLNKRIRDKGEMRNYILTCKTEDLREYESVLMDFSAHRKLARQMGWESTTTDGAKRSIPVVTSPVTLVGTKVKTSWIHKKKRAAPPGSDAPPKKKKKRPAPLLTTAGGYIQLTPETVFSPATPASSAATPTIVSSVTTPSAFSVDPLTPMFDGLPLIDGHVFVGSMKVQIIENLFRCPAEGCFKNFRKDNLLRMHIKHYHRDLRKFLGSTPKVSDLAYARTAIPENTIVPKLKCEGEVKTSKVKLTPKTPTDKTDKKEPLAAETEETFGSTPTTPVKSDLDKGHLQDSPKLRNALENQVPIKRPKVLYPVKKEIKSENSSPRPEEYIGSSDTPDIKPKDNFNAFIKIKKMPDQDVKVNIPLEIEPLLDFESAISTHTVTKPPTYWKRKQKSPKKPKGEGSRFKKEKKKKKTALLKSQPKWKANADDWMTSEDYSSCSVGEHAIVEEQVEPAPAVAPPVPEPPSVDPGFMISETGEKVKIEHMKREEIINCHCGFGEEDGLMIQCDLCLCWQHAICHNYDTNTVPDKYTCSICLNPRRGRRSRRFLHHQSWLYEGALPGAAPDDALRRAHELTGNLVRLTHVLHTLRLKFHVATKKDHPKLYLWAKDWESPQPEAEPLPAELQILRDIGKENLPLREGEGEREDGGLLANLLASPNGTALELPISTSELERLAKSVQEAEAMRVGPEPEAAIESSACREHLLRHIQRLQALIDARLDSIEAQVAELESQDPSFEDDETAEYFPRTKQTFQMLYRDLDTMEELGVIT